jgi:Transglycosylase SLT domain
MSQGALSFGAISVVPLTRPGSPRSPASPPISPKVADRQAVTADPAALCETATTTAEYVGRLPPRLLGAISLTETGRVEPASGRIRPWPWTINAGGEGHFFETKQQAVDAVKALQARGVQSIDVGCLQVNLMYHPDAFASLDDAFDPRANANYATHFLNALYVASKDWPTAVAAYHSETPALGDAYRVLVMARWQNADPRTPVTGRSAYGDFAEDGKAYGSGTDSDRYGAFAPSSRAYGAFAPH